jgi:cytochrome c
VPERRAAFCAGLFLIAILAGCGRNDIQRNAIRMTGGNPDRGPVLVDRYGCGTCHTISAVRGATGLVGPPLDGIARRVYLAGQLPNTAENMIRWIRHPQSIERGTAMPELKVTEQDGRDLAAFLYTLR